MSDKATRSWTSLGVTTLALAASGSTTLGFSIILARTLDPSDYGELARTFALSMAVAQLAMAGLAPALARIVASAPGDQLRFDRAPSAVRVMALGSCATAIIYLPLAFAGFAGDSGYALLGGLAVTAVYATYFGIKMILFALDRVRAYALMEFTSDLIFFACLAVFLFVEPKAALFAFSVAYLVFIVVASRYITRRAANRSAVVLDRGTARFGVLALVSTYASVARFPFVVAIAGFVGTALISAQIALLVGIVMPLFLLPQAAGAMTFANVARQPDGETTHVRHLVRAVALVSALVASVAGLVSADILGVVGGSSYVSAAPSLTLVLFCLVPQLAAIPVGNAAAARGGVGVKALISAAGLAVSVVGTALTVPEFGLMGAAVSLGAGTVLAGSLSLAYGFRHFDLRVSDLAGAGAVCAAGLLGLVVPGGAAAGVVLPVLGAAAAVSIHWWSPSRMGQVTS